VHVVDVAGAGIVLEARVPGERGQIQALPRREIVLTLACASAKPKLSRG
jgi:hypothetical protein